MIHNSVYLYPNKIDVFTNLLDPWVAERYRKVYNRNLKIYRGTDNRIDIQLKNCNQRPTSINGSYLVFTLVSQSDQRLLFHKDFTTIADGSSITEIGRAYVELTQADMRELEAGYYQYSIIQESRTYIGDTYVVTSRKPLYIDSQYGAFAVLEIHGDVCGEPQPSIVVDKWTYVNPFAVGEINNKSFFSSLIDANPFDTTPQSFHTFQLYFSDYKGIVSIEGSVDDQGSQSINWTPIVPEGYTTETIVLKNQHTPLYLNVVGRYSWFRVKHVPEFGFEAKFNIQQSLTGRYIVSIVSEGKNYTNGDIIRIKGTAIGGVDGINDLTIVVRSVNPNGGITSVEAQGLSPTASRAFNGIVAPSGKLDKILYR